MARTGRGDSTRDPGGHIPLLVTIAGARHEAGCMVIVKWLGVSRDVRIVHAFRASMAHDVSAAARRSGPRIVRSSVEREVVRFTAF